LTSLLVAPKKAEAPDNCILICAICSANFAAPAADNANHWRCLNESVWSHVPAVQVVAWRLLHQLAASEDWPQALLDMLDLDDATLAWAAEGAFSDVSRDAAPQAHKDANGVALNVGDSVTLIKDLNVKGGGFTAKRGTAVRNIRLVIDQPGQIEGRINGQQIVILTQFVKKT
jgi:protein PhnA